MNDTDLDRIIAKLDAIEKRLVTLIAMVVGLGSVLCGVTIAVAIVYVTHR